MISFPTKDLVLTKVNKIKKLNENSYPLFLLTAYHYLHVMRLLLSTILFCLAFTLALPVSANDNSTHSILTVKPQQPASSSFKDTDKQVPAALIKPCLQVTAGAVRAKTFSSAHFFITTFIYPAYNAAVSTLLFSDGNSDHEPIALKLLFPKHYFW